MCQPNKKDKSFKELMDENKSDGCACGCGGCDREKKEESMVERYERLKAEGKITDAPRPGGLY